MTSRIFAALADGANNMAASMLDPIQLSKMFNFGFRNVDNLYLIHGIYSYRRALFVPTE